MYNESAARRFELENESEQPHRLDDRQADEFLERVDLKELQGQLESKLKVESEAGPKGLFNADVLRALARLTVELRDRLPEYQTILSDDASGRLPSLLLRRLAQLSRPEEQSAAPQTFFIAGGYGIDQRYKAVQEFIAAKAPTMGKTLLVTEHVFSGQSIGQIADMLRRQGVDFDIAAMTVIEGAPTPANLRYGTVGGFNDESFLAFWGKSSLSGVEKSRKQAGPHPFVSHEQDREAMKAARKDIEKIAQAFMVLLK